MAKQKKQRGKKDAPRPEKAMRVALVWNNTLQAEEELLEVEPVGLGEGHLFPIPDGLAENDSLTILEEAGPVSYQLRLSPSIGGSVWLNGERREVSELGAVGAAIPLGPDDYGVITAGPVALFFQQVEPAPPMPRSLFRIDPAFLASVLLTLLMCAAVIALFVVEYRPLDNDPLELNADLIAQFMVTPPPADLIEQFAAESGTETEDPGLRGREETGGERHRDDEGRVGREDAQREDTHIQGEVTSQVSARVRSMGLLGALSDGGEGNAIAQALDVPTISDILGGMGDAPTAVGRGSRGAGLRGSGSGGGGTGQGALFGAGGVGTGIGTGSGGGTGRGSGGAGARGRKRVEVRISVMRGRPTVSGYLSPEQINRVVRANQSAVRYCYEVEVQRQPNLKGRLEMAWTIDRSGRVSSARVARSTLRSPRVEGCIKRQIQRWRFPEPDGGNVRVSYPFIFGVGG